jgi:hypothetical protein
MITHFIINVYLARKVTVIKRKLLLLEVEKVLMDCLGFGSSGPSRQAFSTPNGMHTYKQNGMTYIFQERPGLHKFLDNVFKHFDVAIFTCATPVKTTRLMDLIFTAEERQQFKFVFTQADVFDTGIRSEFGGGGFPTLLLKDFRVVWKHFGGAYDETNTILVDVLPVRSFANPQWTSLYVKPFFYAENSPDDFLLEILWTTLGFMSHASNDVRCFLYHYTPKWSLLNACRYRRKNQTMWAELDHKFSHKIWKCEYKWTVLDLGKYDMSWDVREKIQNACMESMDKRTMLEFAIPCIGQDYSGMYKSNLRQLVVDIFHQRDTTSKFVNTFPRNGCLQTRKDDRKRRRFTCYNPECLKCWRQTEFIRIMSEERFILK